MMAEEFYQKTLAGYESSLGKGESISLSRYCKKHHVNNRGLRYWMKKNSIISPKGKSGRLAGPSVSDNTTQPVPGSHQMVPLLIQAPTVGKAKKLIRSESSLKDVNITTQTGLVVCIPQISCADLAELILTCNTR
tara:strand:- start:2736 stop:3140 length:405 start_codon:yes stop_codon:yes gene_type:complete